jgi:hypothetical protein
LPHYDAGTLKKLPKYASREFARHPALPQSSIQRAAEKDMNSGCTVCTCELHYTFISAIKKQ